MEATTIKLDNAIYNRFYKAIRLAFKPTSSYKMSGVFRYQDASLILNGAERKIEIVGNRSISRLLSNLTHKTGINLLEAEIV